jgi:hypothetical protein
MLPSTSVVIWFASSVHIETIERPCWAGFTAIHRPEIARSLLNERLVFTIRGSRSEMFDVSPAEFTLDPLVFT